MEVEGGSIFITGGAGVIGKALAGVFLEAGMRVTISDRNEAGLADALAEFANRPDLLGIVHDVANPESWEDAVSQAEAAFGPVSVLCNNAGLASSRRPAHEIDVEDWDRIAVVNLKGVFLGVRSLAPRMIRNGGGHIVNTASMAGVIATTGLGDYTAMKFGVVGLTETIRVELAPFGIGVSLFCPGTTGGGVGRDVEQNRAAVAAGNMDPVWVARRVLEAIRNNELYIFTHPEYRSLVEARSAMLLSAFNDPAQPGFQTPEKQIERMARNAYPPAAR
jgi:NAD(P)-dependent dehydrogenase (short-subunit alcohol dehydrogenase family)